MKKILILLPILCYTLGASQTRKPIKKKITTPHLDLAKINDSIPDLIPQRLNGKLGYINQKGKFIIQPEYNFGTFFWEDCNLLNSPNEKIRKFGTNNYASVSSADSDYRIDKSGKKVYTFKNEDMGKCTQTEPTKIYNAYSLQGFYGIINMTTFTTPTDYRQFQIYPVYQYLHVLEGNTPENPMIVAVHNDKFGVINIYNKIIIPFEYSDIKRNFSWKMANMFEVTKDGKNYYFIDNNNKAY